MSNEIFKDENQIRKRINEAELVILPANKVLQLIKDEGLTPTKEHFNGFVSGGGDYLIGALGAIARQDIEKMNLKLDRMKQSFLLDATMINQKRASETHAELYRAMNASMIKADDLDIESGQAKLKKSFLEAVEQQFTVTLDTQAKMEMWESIQNFTDSFNAMEAIAERTGILSLQKTIDVDEAFILTLKKEGVYARAQPDPSFFLGYQGIGKLASNAVVKK